MTAEGTKRDFRQGKKSAGILINGKNTEERNV